MRVKTILCALRIFFAMSFFGGVAWAANSDVDIHCVARKLDEKVNQGSGEGTLAVSKEHWVYDFTVENKTFKDLTGLEVKYLIFFSQEQLGVKAAATPQRQTGTVTINLLKAHEKKSFTTDPVELKKANLVGNYHYPSGARPNARDTLTGLWVRLFQGGQQFAEYANPSTLLREKWE